MIFDFFVCQRPLGSRLCITGDEHRSWDGATSGGSGYQFGDNPGAEEGIRQQDFGGLFGGYQHYGFGSGLVLFDDISTKKGGKKEQGNCRSSVLLVAGGANQGYNL